MEQCCQSEDARMSKREALIWAGVVLAVGFAAWAVCVGVPFPWGQ